MGPVRVEFIFDTICPWCYVGKRRLERALAMRPRLRVELCWQPFLLNPDMPPEGMPRDDYLDRKFGSRHRVHRLLLAASAAAEGEGLRLDFDAIRRTPNSLRSHRLIAWAAREGKAAEAVEAVFAAYFTQGRDIGDWRVLGDIAADLGIAVDDLTDWLVMPPDPMQARADNARSHRQGINGVPCFVFDDIFAIAGAQEPDVMLRLLDLAQESRFDRAFSQA